MSLSKQILAYLASQYPLAIHSGELERIAMENGYKASNCGRRCRELQNEGLIKVIYNEKHEATYKWIPGNTDSSTSAVNPISTKFLEDFKPSVVIQEESKLW